MTDHSTPTPLPLDHESILIALFETIDSAAEMGNKLHGATRLSLHLEYHQAPSHQYGKWHIDFAQLGRGYFATSRIFMTLPVRLVLEANSFNLV
jgi:hypothetical protein